MATTKRKSQKNGIRDMKDDDPTAKLFRALDGRHFTLDGVSGVLSYEKLVATYPYPHVDHSFHHTADAKGRRSEEYLKVRRILRDDWSTDLTNSERLGEIAQKLRVNTSKL
jgi:hypothetical protein